MSVEQNKAIARHIPEDIFSQGNLAKADEIIAPDFVDTTAPPGTPPGPEGIKQFAAMFRAAFPDVHYTVDIQLGEGDLVTHRVTGRATMKGEFMGNPPSGKQATWTETHITRIVNGKIVEHWGNYDQLGMLQQFGLLPSAEEQAV